MPRRRSPDFPLKTFLFLWVGIFALLVVLRWEPLPLPYVLRESRLIPKPGVAPILATVVRPSAESGDVAVVWSGDRDPVSGHWFGTFECYDDSGRQISDHAFRLPISSIEAEDVTGDGIGELLLSVQNDTMAALCVLSWPEQREIARFEVRDDVALRGKKPWDAGVSPLMILPDAQTGQPFLLLRMGAGYGLYPRGLVLFDAVQKRVIWQHDIAATVTRVDTMDADGDGKVELYVGTYGPNNGAHYAETSDDQAYLECLTIHGTVLWRQNWDCPNVGVLPFCVRDHDEHGAMLVVLKHSNRDEAGPNELYRVIPRVGDVADTILLAGRDERDAMVPWYSHHGCPTFLISEGDAGLTVFDDGLRRVMTYPELHPVLLDTLDVNNDGRWELVAFEPGGRTVVYDSSLQLLAQFPGRYGRVAVQRSRSGPGFVWATATDGVYRMEFVANPEMEHVRLRRVLMLAAWLGIGLGAAILAATVLYWLKRSRRAEQEREQQRRNAEVMTQVASHLGHTIKNLLGHFGRVLRNRLFEMESTTDTGAVLNELNTQYDRVRRDVAAEILAIKKIADSTLLQRSRVDLGQLVRKWLEGEVLLSKVRPIELKLQDQPQPVAVDPPQLETVLANLVDNALKAMDGREGGITISVFTAPNGDGIPPQVVLEVQDDGCGIDPDGIGAMLEGCRRNPESGKGWGMPFIVKTVRDHGGTLRVSSAAGHGTTITIELPKYQES